jgi:hypothetical protein
VGIAELVFVPFAGDLGRAAVRGEGPIHSVGQTWERESIVGLADLAFEA